MRCAIPNNNNLFRHSNYPVSFKGKAFAHEKLIALRGDAGDLHTSVAWEKYVPTIEYVHDYGCRVACGINKRRKEAGTFKQESRHVYCGAYQLTAASVRSLASGGFLDDVVLADVIHKIENHEIAHVDLRISLRPGSLDVEGTKTAIVDRLWNACSGPMHHVCAYDEGLLPHSTQLLEYAPNGEYVDRRVGLTRLLHIVRFVIWRWLWQNFCPSANR